ncbi:MAG: D-2-hydroxyacid dehydrogenase [Acidimicrobiales bacterium]
MSDVPVVALLVAPDEPTPPGLGTLSEQARLVVVRTLDEVVAALRDAAVLAVYDIHTPLVRQLGDRVSHLRWIHAASAGVDAVLTPDVLCSPCVVTNAAGIFDRPIAEYCIAVLLGFVKDLPRTLGFQRARQWRHRETRPLAGRHLMVVGAGSIGSEVGRLGRALGMEARGIARTARDGHPVFGHLYGSDELSSQLGWAHDVVICTPLTEATRGMFDLAAFAALTPGAHLVNVGRGPVVDEVALLAAVRSGVVAGAALDVFEQEPLPAEHPFWGMEQVIVSPHMSGDERGWREALGAQFVENFHRWRRGEPLHQVVKEATALSGDPAGPAVDLAGLAGDLAGPAGLSGDLAGPAVPGSGSHDSE